MGIEPIRNPVAERAGLGNGTIRATKALTNSFPPTEVEENHYAANENNAMAA